MPFLFEIPYQSLRSWQKSSFSLFLQGWLILWAWTVIFGQKKSCGGQGKDRGSCEDDEATYCVPVKACLTKLTLQQRKTLQWGLCIINEMHISLWCGCRNVNRRVTLGVISSQRPPAVEAAVLDRDCCGWVAFKEARLNPRRLRVVFQWQRVIVPQRSLFLCFVSGVCRADNTCTKL